MRKWNLALTYEPKIAGVRSGTITQTIRLGRKYSEGDLVAFHGWADVPYRSPWSWRTEYKSLCRVYNILVMNNGLLWLDDSDRKVVPWADLGDLAKRDGLNPPTGDELASLFLPLPKGADTIEAQILRWG